VERVSFVLFTWIVGLSFGLIVSKWKGRGEARTVRIGKARKGISRKANRIGM
jgi:hypothetical protein